MYLTIAIASLFFFFFFLFFSLLFEHELTSTCAYSAWYTIVQWNVVFPTEFFKISYSVHTEQNVGEMPQIWEVHFAINARVAMLHSDIYKKKQIANNLRLIKSTKAKKRAAFLLSLHKRSVWAKANAIHSFRIASTQKKTPPTYLNTLYTHCALCARKRETKPKKI